MPFLMLGEALVVITLGAAAQAGAGATEAWGAFA